MFPAAAVIFVAVFQTIWWLPFALAAPTTVIALPMIHVFVPNPVFRTLALVAGGGLSGLATIYAVLEGLVAGGANGTGHHLILYAGTIAGVAAAAAFDSIARDLD